MKKIYTIFIVLCLCSCDKFIYYDIAIQNNCNDTIEVVLERTYQNPGFSSFSISAQSELIIAKPHTIFTVNDKSVIIVFIKKLEISKEGTPINLNPLDTSRWSLEKINKWEYKYLLTLYPEDFE
ncbi:MAG: hypothetical protein LBU51_00325 [Bacteroidales bacterium]|jgi:hypothetical protein|nr:hypothetical protein [Bacteroidales bacterium]